METARRGNGEIAMLNFKKFYSLCRMVEMYMSTGLADEKFFFVMLLKYFGNLSDCGVTFLDTVHLCDGDFYENVDIKHTYGILETGEELLRKSLCFGEGGGLPELYTEFFTRKSDWNWNVFFGSEEIEKIYSGKNEDQEIDPIILAWELFPPEIPLPQKEDFLYECLSGMDKYFFEMGMLYLFWNERLGDFLKWQKSYEGKYKKVATFLRKMIYTKVCLIFDGGEWLYTPKDDKADRCIFLFSVNHENIESDELTSEGYMYLMLIERMVEQFDKIYHFTRAQKEVSATTFKEKEHL